MPGFCDSGWSSQDSSSTLDEDELFGSEAIQGPGGSQRLYAVDNRHVEKWTSPGATPPPASSSPNLDPSPAPARAVDVDVTTNRPLCVYQRSGGQSRVNGVFNDRMDSSGFIFPTTASVRPRSPTSIALSRSASYQEDTLASGPSITARLSAMSKQPAANRDDICAPRTPEPTGNPTMTDETNGVSALEAFELSNPFIALIKAVFYRGTGNGQSSNAATTTESQDITSELPHRRVPVVPVSYPTQPKPENRLKRQRSSVECAPEPKKLKLQRTLTHISSAADSNVEPQYQATEPASLRRAESLRSESSEHSKESMDSLFYPSPLSPPGSRFRADKDNPPTVPSTPLPDSVDYAKSKANPMVRTIQFYRRRSLEVPPIPPVPIIAPPQNLPPAMIRCREDYAIDRIKALLRREHDERERDSLDSCDDKRAARWKEFCAFISQRESENTPNSNINQDQWEEGSTVSATESQESQDPMPSVGDLCEQHRPMTRAIWSNAFGITNDFRKEVAHWFLEVCPREPVPRENPEECRDKRPIGTDLYDQLTNSPQTRFHAAQLFHRYFLLPEKVELWRECMQDWLEQELCEVPDEFSGRRGVWALATACMALAIKFHRDAWLPLFLISADEFIALSPFPMSHNTFELAQRDIMYTFQFMLGTCTPQDFMDELWEALPTLRKASAVIQDGCAVVQRKTWEKLFESILEPDMLQYPVSMLTAAALVYVLESEVAPVMENDAPAEATYTGCNDLVVNAILDIQDVLEISNMELDECRDWMSHVGA